MKHCSHCGVYEAHSHGVCRRCVSAYVSNRQRFERLRRPGFFARVYIALFVAAMLVEEMLRDLRRSPT